MANQFLAELAAAALPELISEIEVRSAVSPPYVINVAEALKPGPKADTPAARALAKIRPTVILRGSVGTRVLAPYGVVGRDDWKKTAVALGVGALLVGGLIGAFWFGRE